MRAVPDLIAARAAATPSAVAICDGDRWITYGELLGWADNVAFALRERGAGRDVVVGVVGGRSIEYVVGALGALRAGACYVAVDENYPAERREFMLADAGVCTVLDRAAVAACAVLAPSDSAIPGAWSPAARDLAYVVYTSGSTGTPKGVGVEHGSLSNLIRWHHTTFHLCPADRYLLVAGIGFDVAVGELWESLTAGATVVIADESIKRSPRRLRDFIVDTGITQTELPTALCAELLTLPWPDDTALHVMRTGGEQLLTRPPVGLPFILFNTYGPAETTVNVTCGRVEPGPGLPTIGLPFAGATIHLRDERGVDVPDGEPGEMYVGGPGVARGYLGRPELTAERFLDEPGAGRLYRTGDLVRRRADGELEFLGRADDQVQIRGYRVEPGEVRATLVTHPGVADAAVLATTDAVCAVSLAAFYVPQAEGPSPTAIRRWLAERLPAQMVPATVRDIAALPLNPNGKVDRTALRELTGAVRVPGAPARDAAEEVLTHIWTEVLGFAVGIDEPFDDLGGHSLAAMRIVARIADRGGVDVAPERFFGSVTIAELAAEIGPRLSSGVNTFSDNRFEVSTSDSAPLTSAQARYWFLDQFATDRALYNISDGFAIDGAIDEEALRRTLNDVVRRHAALRTAIIDGRDGPRQQVLPAVPIDFDVHDLRANHEAAKGIFETLAARPFDLAKAPLLRAALVRLGEGSWRLGLTVHHIAFDGWSTDVLLREIAAIYPELVADRVVPQGHPLPTSIDVAVWEQSQQHATDVDYWTRTLDGAPALLDLPTEQGRPPFPSFRGATAIRRFPAGLSAAVDRLARAGDASPFMVWLTALYTLLWRYTGETDLVVGTPVADRRPEFEEMIGCFVNTLALRVDLSGNPTFGTALHRVRQVAVDGYAHRSLPFDQLVEALGRTGQRDHHPLFQVMLVMQQPQITEIRLPAATLSHLGELFPNRARFDLTLVLEGDKVCVEYATDLFDAPFADRLLDHLFLILTGATAQTPLDELNLLTPAARQQVLSLGDGGPPHRPGPVHHRIAGPPSKPAVICDGKSITYAELDFAANGLAHVLRERGVIGEAPVAVCLPRSIDTVVAMIAVHRAGGAYVPLDLTYPDDRLRMLLADVAPALVICLPASVDRLHSLGSRAIAIVDPGQPGQVEPPDEIGERWGSADDSAGGVGERWRSVDGVAGGVDEHSKVAGGAAGEVGERWATADGVVGGVDEHSLADIMFTSGSTGRPKGVLLTHGGLANLVAAKIDRFDVRPDSRVLQFVSFGFSVSISDVYMTLTAGATLVLRGDTELAGADLVSLIQQHQVTNLVLPASVLAALPEAELPSVRAITVGGEECGAALVDRWAPGRRFVNAYGPTEATTATATGVCTPGEGRPAIGTPIAGARVYILDHRRNPVPIGVPGELYIGGTGVARGYLNRPDLTTERFLPDPCTGGRMYRTGDLARWRSDGQITLLGRNDDQVNVRGARVEIGEVEAALRAHPALSDAAVAVHRDTAHGERLVAYLISTAANPLSAAPNSADAIPNSAAAPVGALPSAAAAAKSSGAPFNPAGAIPDSGAVPDTAALREFLRQRLPDHAVPTAFVVLAALPRTATGKVDRRALPAPVEPGGGVVARAAVGPIEEMLVEIWAEVLGVEAGVDDDFFALGGQSILAATLAGRIRHRFEIPLPVQALFETPTIATLAISVEKALMEELA